MRSERWSEKPQDEGSTPSRSTISGTIDEMVKSPAPQAGGCGFNSHWYHQSIRCVRRIGRVTSLSRWSLWVRHPYASPFLWESGRAEIAADCKSAALGLRWFKSNLSHQYCGVEERLPCCPHKAKTPVRIRSPQPIYMAM